MKFRIAQRLRRCHARGWTPQSQPGGNVAARFTKQGIAFAQLSIHLDQTDSASIASAWGWRVVRGAIGVLPRLTSSWPCRFWIADFGLLT